MVFLIREKFPEFFFIPQVDHGPLGKNKEAFGAFLGNKEKNQGYLAVFPNYYDSKLGALLSFRLHFAEVYFMLLQMLRY